MKCGEFCGWFGKVVEESFQFDLKIAIFVKNLKKFKV